MRHEVRDYEFDMVFADGTSRCWLGNAVPSFDETGQSRGAVVGAILGGVAGVAARMLRKSQPGISRVL
jgi:hypothetical protein